MDVWRLTDSTQQPRLLRQSTATTIITNRPVLGSAYGSHQGELLADVTLDQALQQPVARFSLPHRKLGIVVQVLHGLGPFFGRDNSGDLNLDPLFRRPSLGIALWPALVVELPGFD